MDEICLFRGKRHVKRPRQSITESNHCDDTGIEIVESDVLSSGYGRQNGEDTINDSSPILQTSPAAKDLESSSSESPAWNAFNSSMKICHHAVADVETRCPTIPTTISSLPARKRLPSTPKTNASTIQNRHSTVPTAVIIKGNDKQQDQRGSTCVSPTTYTRNQTNSRSPDIASAARSMTISPRRHKTAPSSSDPCTIFPRSQSDIDGLRYHASKLVISSTFFLLMVADLKSS